MALMLLKMLLVLLTFSHLVHDVPQVLTEVIVRVLMLAFTPTVALLGHAKVGLFRLNRLVHFVLYIKEVVVDGPGISFAFNLSHLLAKLIFLYNYWLLNVDFFCITIGAFVYKSAS